MSLLNTAIHKDSTSGTEVYGFFSKKGFGCKLAYAHSEGAGKIIQKASAAGGTGLI